MFGEFVVGFASPGDALFVVDSRVKVALRVVFRVKSEA
jgi:hypothetical protein